MENKKSYWLKSGLLTFAGRISVILFGVGSIILLLRALTKAEFGTWVLYLTVISFIEVGRIGLLQNALVKYLSGEEGENYRKISTASLVLNGILTFICAIILALLAYPLSQLWDAPELMNMLLLYTITTTFLIPYIQFNATQQANLDFRGVFWSQFTKQGLLFLFILTLYLTNNPITLISLASFQIFTAAASSFVSYFFTRPYIQLSREIDWKWVKELFNFGKFVLGTNLSTMIYKNIDKMMLATMLSRPAVAIYELAIRITNLAEVPTFSIANIVFPQSARQANQGKEGIKFLYEKSVGAILAFILPFILFVLIFPEWVIYVIGGEKYADTVPLLRLTMLYGLFIPFSVQFGTVLDSMGKPRVNFYFTILGAVANIVFNYLFISLYGVMGAAIGTLTTYCVMFVAIQYVLYREINVKVWNAFKYIIPFYFEAFNMIRSMVFKNPTAPPPSSEQEDTVVVDSSISPISEETTISK